MLLRKSVFAGRFRLRGAGTGDGGGLEQAMGFRPPRLSATRSTAMPSPFPGMNPWLEQEGLWQDFHTKLLVAVSERLVPQVGPNYFVLLEHQIYIQEGPAEKVRRLRADLLVTHSPSGAQQPVGAAVLDAPAQVEHPALDVERMPYLEVRHAARGDLVTVLELLSFSNKQGENRQQYL